MSVVPATLVAKTNGGGGLVRVALRPDPDVIAEYTIPGQYLVLRVGHAKGYFVIANEPGAAVWDLMVRPAPGAAEALLALPIGDSVQVSRAQGSGFGLARFEGKPLVLALGGSGVAVAKPVASARSAADLVHTFVYLGLRDALDPPGLGDLHWLRAQGVSVVLCESGLAQEGRPPPPFDTEPGRLQDVLARRDVLKIARDVVFAGPDGAAQALVHLGFAVHHNHG